jgi:hypothetical protein
MNRPARPGTDSTFVPALALAVHAAHLPNPPRVAGFAAAADRRMANMVKTSRLIGAFGEIERS